MKRSRSMGGPVGVAARRRTDHASSYADRNGRAIAQEVRALAEQRKTEAEPNGIRAALPISTLAPGTRIHGDHHPPNSAILAIGGRESRPSSSTQIACAIDEVTISCDLASSRSSGADFPRRAQRDSRCALCFSCYTNRPPEHAECLRDLGRLVVIFIIWFLKIRKWRFGLSCVITVVVILGVVYWGFLSARVGDRNTTQGIQDGAATAPARAAGITTARRPASRFPPATLEVPPAAAPPRLRSEASMPAAAISSEPRDMRRVNCLNCTADLTPAATAAPSTPPRPGMPREHPPASPQPSRPSALSSRRRSSATAAQGNTL